MSDTSVSIPNTDNEKETAAFAGQVRDFLIAHPNFLSDNPKLLSQIEVPDARVGAVSLVELQNTQLKKNVEQLTNKLSHLIEMAKETQEKYEIFADLNIRLLKAKSLDQLRIILADVLQKALMLCEVKLHLFNEDTGLPEIQQRLFLDKRFKGSSYFFGRLSDNERKLILEKPEVASCALILLGEDKPIGILAMGSAVDDHFTPNMDTLVLGQLLAFLNAVLPEMIDNTPTLE